MTYKVEESKSTTLHTSVLPKKGSQEELNWLALQYNMIQYMRYELMSEEEKGFVEYVTYRLSGGFVI